MTTAGPKFPILAGIQKSKKIWLTSDQSGFKHLYTVGIDGKELKQITHGDWEIHSDSFSHDPQWIGDSIYYSSTQAGTAERQIYRVKAAGGSAPERLSKEEGLHIGWISEDGQSRAELRADMQNPFDLYVDGARVTKSPRAEFYQAPWAATRFVTYPSLKDHKPVAARLLLPPGYNPDRPGATPRPAIVYIHGAGYATSVLKQWGSYQELRFVFNNFLAQQGYVVLEMDYRGSTNYGRDWRSGVYLNMGGPDLEDVLGGVEYLRGLKNIDMGHVGIWGWSYGGFMTAMAMFRTPATFKAGAAFSGSTIGPITMPITQANGSRRRRKIRKHTGVAHLSIFRASYRIIFCWYTALWTITCCFRTRRSLPKN